MDGCTRDPDGWGQQVTDHLSDEMPPLTRFSDSGTVPPGDLEDIA